jgi:uncharacterized protein (DUF2147 family)
MQDGMMNKNNSMIKLKTGFLIVFSFFLFNSKASLAQNSVEGVWLTHYKEAKVKIFQYNGKVYGKIVWLQKPYNEHGKEVTDKNNPNKNLRNRKLMKLTILRNFEYENGKWVNGTLYDPTDGGTYKCKLWLENKNTLKVRGYAGILYETETWTRTKP